MSIDLIKRSELARGLTNAELDGNLTALEAHINGLLAGTAGYEAGNALKLGGVLASETWSNANCTKSVGVNGWRRLADGLLEGWAYISITSGTPFNFNTACGVTFSSPDSLQCTPVGTTAYPFAIQDTAPTAMKIVTTAPPGTSFLIRSIGRP